MCILINQPLPRSYSTNTKLKSLQKSTFFFLKGMAGCPYEHYISTKNVYLKKSLIRYTKMKLVLSENACVEPKRIWNKNSTVAIAHLVHFTISLLRKRITLIPLHSFHNPSSIRLWGDKSCGHSLHVTCKEDEMAEAAELILEHLAQSFGW